MDAKQVSATILNQLGGRRFVAMTGSKNFIYADITEANSDIWLRMDLTQNRARVNRLKITLNANDTYTMEFYRQVMKTKPTFDVVISNQQTFEGVYAEQLPEIFTQVTGMYTSL